nr:hypothetical protein [Brevibacterium aurantiacum]
MAAHSGYAQVAQLAKQALATDERISELVIARGLLEREQLDEILQPERLSGLSADHSVTNDADSAEAVPRDGMTGEFEVVPEPKM